MTEPGELNKPLLQAADDSPPAPPTPPQPQVPEPPTQPTAAPPPPLFGTGAPAPPPYAGAQSAPAAPSAPPPSTPLPPERPVPAQPHWRRGLAIFAVVMMVLVGGALLGNASRGGSLFSSDSSTTAQNTPANGSSNTSSVSPSQGSSNVSGVTGKVQPGLVNITTTLDGGAGEGAGTGMVISSNGEVLTNNHVIDNAESINVEIGGNGEEHSAKVIGYDVADDVALVKIDDVSGLATIPVGNPDNVTVGDPIVVLGNAQGRGGDPTAASGTITALNRQITATDADGSNPETLNNLIQVQADVQPGDSGGALISSDGQVIGMTTAASSNGFRFQQQTDGLGFGIRIDKALSVIKQIRNGEETDGVHVGSRALLGVDLQSESALPGRGGGSTSSGSGDGAEVLDVPDGPAKDAGIEAGDVIVSLGDTTITSTADLTTAIGKYHAGDKAQIGWTDGSGSTQHATVKFAESPPA